MEGNELKEVLKKYTKPYILELGCGSNKRLEGSVGIDQLEHPTVDLKGDIIEVLSVFDAESVQKVHSHHVLEHIQDLDALFEQIDRVLIRGGIIETVVPHFSNSYFYSDHTHKRAFGLYSFNNFFQSNYFTRQVGQYGNTYSYSIVDVKLIFKSARPFYFRYLIKKILSVWVNMSTWTKEFYEENLIYILPCYEVKFILKKK
jgi:hypothetical protein